MAVDPAPARAKRSFPRQLLSRRATPTAATPPDTPVTETAPEPAPEPVADPTLEQQAKFFHAFGALKVPGLFAAEIATIREGFDEIFRDHPSAEVDPKVSLHKVMDPARGTPRRQITTGFIEKNAKLDWLRDDERILELARALLGDDCEYGGSTGNVFNSYIYWHSDYFRSTVPAEVHLKFAFYLDELDAKSGALRVIPGTNHLGSYRWSLYDEDRAAKPGSLADVFGMPEHDLPCWVLSVKPGDLVVFDNRTLHANFNGGSNRRMFSLQFAQATAPE